MRKLLFDPRKAVPDFDPVPHVYTLTKRVVPGVTGIMKDVGWVEDRWFTEEARELGTTVHEIRDLISKKDLDWSHLRANFSPEIVARARAYRLFEQETGYVSIASELASANPELQYGTHIDDFGYLPAKRYCIVETKSGAPQWWTKYQTAGQARTLKIPVLRYQLQLRPDGTYRFTPHRDFGDYSRWDAAAITHLTGRMKS